MFMGSDSNWLNTLNTELVSLYKRPYSLPHEHATRLTKAQIEEQVKWLKEEVKSIRYRAEKAEEQAWTVAIKGSRVPRWIRWIFGAL